MYYVLMGLLLFGLGIGLVCIVRLALLSGSVDSKFLLISIILAEVYGLGYLKEMLATTPEESFAATGLQYVGFAYLAFVYTQFIMKYTHFDKKIPSWISLVFYAFDTVILSLAFTCKYHDFYYTTKTWVEDGLYPHMVKGKSILYWLFLVSEVFLLLASAFAVLYRYHKSSSKSERKRLLFIFVETLLPIVAVALNVGNFLGGYDLNPVLLIIMISAMTFSLLRGTMYDIINLAHMDYFESTNVANIVIDSEFHYIDSNAQARLIFPELAKWENGRDISELKVEGIENKEGINFEKNGFYYQTVYEKLEQKQGLLGYIICISNVTDTYKQMENMRELKEKADSANAAKSRYLANMSHEIRTPLNAIIGMAEIANREPSVSRIQEYVTQIKSSGLILLDIINDVLDFSKAESGKLELVEAEYDFCDVINSVVNITNVRISDKPINLYLDVKPAIPRRLIGDEVRVRQIFMNLMGNAAKYTREGYIELTVDYEKAEDGIYLRILLEDSGVGIKKEDIKKIFNPFQQVDLNNNRNIEGSGLGLSITKQLIELMDGELNVQSVYGTGTRFFVKIYQAMASMECLSDALEHKKILVEKNSVFSLHSSDFKDLMEDENYTRYPDAKVLVVDDNEVNLYVAKGLLRLFGIECECASGGRECIEKVKTKKYDLIFMDHLMSGMDGIQATRKLYETCKEQMEQTIVIACTANVDKRTQELFKEAGMKDYISKPILTEELGAVLSRNLVKNA